METKSQQVNALLEEMRGDSSMEDIWVVRKGENVNVGLINQFKHHQYLPNKWFDWERIADAPIMIIGQDWGPYNILRESLSTFDKHRVNDNSYFRDFTLKNLSSRTEKFIKSSVESTYEMKFDRSFRDEQWDLILFTISVLFTRRGSKFRGNENFDQKKSFDHSFKYVSRQIEILRPKLIITLGNMAFDVVNIHYDLGYENPKITDVINKLGDHSIIELQSCTILPNFHPAAHIDPKKQILIWSKMWEQVEL